jgi:hypothetical protein
MPVPQAHLRALISEHVAIRKAGRPVEPLLIPDERTRVVLRGVGKVFGSLAEAAAVLNVSRFALSKFLKRHPEMQDAYDTGWMEGCISLRRSNIQLARKNAAMAIFLSTNVLGMDNSGYANYRAAQTGAPGESAVNVEGPSPREKVESRIARLADAIRASESAEEADRQRVRETGDGLAVLGETETTPAAG